MYQSVRHILVLFKRLGILLAVYSIFRLLFLLFNYSFFSGTRLKELLFIFLHGLRFDFAIIIILNAIFIFAHLIPFQFRDRLSYQRFLKIIFWVVNIPAIVFNAIDLVYFRFTFKRTTSDIFMWKGLGQDLKNLLPKMITDFWYVILVFAALIYLINFLYKKTTFKRHYDDAKTYVLFQFVVGFACFVLFFIGARGGLQLRPISILSASYSISPQNVSLVLNTPFTLIQTIEKNDLKLVNYYDKEVAEDMFPVIQKKDSCEFRKQNVIIIILESFSKEYIGALNPGNKGYTPFLDSLIGESLSFNNAFANGKKSIEGIPCVVAGIPGLMDNPYISSAYAGNQFNSIPGLLKKAGYSSAFFHGGTNGTMGFDNFSRMAGFDKYYGRKEYANDADYDGYWGIWDEEFLQYFERKLEQTAGPFINCLFTLSSHHPFTVPAKYKGKFKKGALEIYPTIEYTDMALKRFFEKASRTEWFKNTLFVITADHTSMAGNIEYSNNVGTYRIPLLFYKYGSDLKGKREEVVQQIDILPSVMDYLCYQDSFISFGRSVFKKEEMHFAINYINNIYQYFEGNYVLQFDGEKSIGLFNFSEDPHLFYNKVKTLSKLRTKMEEKTKAIIQVYNERLINNKLVIH